ncbi:hypothetical protein ABZZ47_09400 [Streptomyces sp. NPDC006465]|uniref:hypothetical protein n=1 Tax=Streptomyces sp. NPDC006465 TaxID=3157174 RepID=UPI0033AD52FD
MGGADRIGGPGAARLATDHDRRAQRGQVVRVGGGLAGCGLLQLLAGGGEPPGVDPRETREGDLDGPGTVLPFLRPLVVVLVRGVAAVCVRVSSGLR